jgi:hypothetical protein
MDARNSTSAVTSSQVADSGNASINLCASRFDQPSVHSTRASLSLLFARNNLDLAWLCPVAWDGW